MEPGAILKGLEQCFANQVWRLSARAADADIDAGLAEIDRQKLGMAVGQVQQRKIAKGGQLVDIAGRLCWLFTPASPVAVLGPESQPGRLMPGRRWRRSAVAGIRGVKWSWQTSQWMLER